MKEKIINTINEKKMVLAPVGVAGASLLGAIPVFAEGEPSGNITSGMTTALGTAFTAVQTDVVTLITTALPYAAAIMGIGMALSIGIRQFKKISGGK